MLESEGEIERVRTVSDVVSMDGRVPAITPVVPAPNIANLNVSKSSKVHIGSKFVSVTQNVHNPDLVKDLPLRQYLWDVVKNSSTTERLCCAVAVIVVIVCVSLIVYFTTTSSKAAAAAYDKAPHEWKIKREMWLAQPYLDNSLISPQFAPVMLVVIQHTVGPECNRFVLCAAELRNLQQWFLKSLEYDIPYNFLIGNDGRVYEGRGWNVEGAHTLGYNRCSVGIGFTGDYREEIPSHASVTEAQMNRTRMILAEGVKLGYLRPDYLIVGALDLGDTASPGSNLYNAIRKWPNYDHKNRFNGLTCEQMQNIYGNQTLWDFKATGKAEH